ncbi:MAG: helix-turn-helix domain-containing protein [Candidatus Helarchaeota archaeon]
MENEKLELVSQYWWLFGRSGGETRIKIINLLMERPYNANQLSNKLEMSYRNIKHHLKILKDLGVVAQNSDQKYGKIFVINSKFNKDIFNEVIKKRKSET